MDGHPDREKEKEKERDVHPPDYSSSACPPQIPTGAPAKEGKISVNPGHQTTCQAGRDKPWTLSQDRYLRLLGPTISGGVVCLAPPALL